MNQFALQIRYRCWNLEMVPGTEITHTVRLLGSRLKEGPSSIGGYDYNVILEMPEFVDFPAVLNAVVARTEVEEVRLIRFPNPEVVSSGQNVWIEERPGEDGDGRRKPAA